MPCKWRVTHIPAHISRQKYFFLLNNIFCQASCLIIGEMFCTPMAKFAGISKKYHEEPDSGMELFVDPVVA